jgi:hypothetical protein
MFRNLLAIEPALANGGRLPSLAQVEGRIRSVEIGCLFLLGVATAAIACFVELNLKIPGHAIIRVVLPISLGLALVPRRGSATAIGTIAMGTGLMLNATRLGSAGMGAMTSVLLSGVLLDFVGSRVRSGWQLYIGMALAGLATNVVAFGVKALSKILVLGVAGSHQWHTWWPRAVVTYPLCGLAAGLICAMILFRFRQSDECHKP